jgi:uncharacterized protein YbjT (DUF2867 family)
MTQTTALIVGATGAVGRQLTELLLASPAYTRVVVLHRSPTAFARRAKVEEHVVDFANFGKLALQGPVQDVFCCVGTTQKTAGSTPAFQRVDRDIPVALARWAAANAARTFVTLSSVGADASARSVYLRTKGEMERGVADAGVRSTYILRPSLLAGERSEFRLKERVGNRVLAVVGPLMVGPVRKYRAVATATVAKAMLACAVAGKAGVHIVESDAIEDLGG